MADLICSICLFDTTDPADLSPEEQHDRELLTVINGNLVCVTHQGYISPSLDVSRARGKVQKVTT